MDSASDFGSGAFFCSASFWRGNTKMRKALDSDGSESKYFGDHVPVVYLNSARLRALEQVGQGMNMGRSNVSVPATH